MKQYGIWLAKLPSIPGSSVQQGTRPVVIVSNDAANEHSSVIMVVPLTSQLGKNALPTHVFLNNYMALFLLIGKVYEIGQVIINAGSHSTTL